MSFSENDYSALHEIGNAPVTRNLMPTLRASIRRLDPDGVSSVAYYPAASGKTLRVRYTKEVSTVVTEFLVNIALASNSYVAIIAAINAVDAGHLEAADQDGFLVVRNRNTGKTHFVRIEAWTTPANDAAPIFGFAIHPFPGSVSYAGEIASTPGIRNEANPQGTALIGRDEDLKAETFNRSLADIYHKLDTLRAELERDVLVWRQFTVEVVEHPVAGNNVFYLDDPTVRVPIIDPDESFAVEYIRGGASGTDYTTAGHSVITVSNVFYVNDSTTDFDSNDPFAVWGTPDGGLVWHVDVPAATKHPEIAITSVDGNVIFCDGATFQSLFIQKGDLVLVEDATKAPFDCSGWFAVLEVFDQEHLSVRRLSPSELTPSVANRPAQLSPSLTGTITIPMGYAVPATENIAFEVSLAVGTNDFTIACLVPLREALSTDWGRAAGTADAVGGALSQLEVALQDHITNTTGDAHVATGIDGFTSTAVWRDSAPVTGATLRAFLEDLITQLQDIGPLSNGAAKLGCASVDLGGNPSELPYQLPAQPIYNSIRDLLSQIRIRTNYLQNAAWADGTTLTDDTVVLTITEIVQHLAERTTNTDTGTDGTARIGIDYKEDASGNVQWNGGTLKSVINLFQAGGVVHAGEYFLLGTDFTPTGHSGGSLGFIPGLEGQMVLDSADIPAALVTNVSKLVPLPPAAQDRSYFYDGGEIVFRVIGGTGSTCTASLVRVSPDGDGVSVLTTFFNTAYTAGTYAEDLNVATGQYLKDYNVSLGSGGHLAIRFSVSAGDSAVIVGSVKVQIRYGDPTP